MAKKKKVYDTETGEVVEVGGGNQPCVMMELIDGFCNTFQPCDNEDDAEEVYSIGRLREYFQTFTMPGAPDAFPKYLSELAARGYRLHTSYSGEPAIFVKWDDFPMKP